METRSITSGELSVIAPERDAMLPPKRQIKLTRRLS